MGLLLFLLFTVVPVLELYLLLQLGGAIGGLPTIGLVLFTGVVGAALARREGLRVLTDWQTAMGAGRLPSEGVASGLLVLVGGVLLVTPGLLTDIVGFSLLIPWTRSIVARWLKAWAMKRVQMTQVQMGASMGSPFAGTQSANASARGVSGEVIDVVVEPPDA